MVKIPAFRLIWLIFALLFTGYVAGQSSLSYGFKAGLNYNQFNGELEASESFERTTGFHIGIIFKYPLTDLFGLKGEFVYSQRGGQYKFNGSSFLLLPREPSPLLMNGTRDMQVDISNNYLDFPLLAYAKFGRFEFNAGVTLSILAGSIGAGQMKFTGINPTSETFTLNLDYRYFGDKARESAQFGSLDIRIPGETIRMPSQLGAYYEYEKKDGNLFLGYEIGWLAGFSFYLNDGLFLGVRGNFGLLDVTRKAMDISLSKFNGNVPALQNSRDTQRSIQISLGFSF